jgi:NitT/TauT family transport system substrate-binding protein
MGINHLRQRRWIAALAAASLALGVTACGGDDNEDEKASSGGAASAPAAVEKKQEVEKLKVTLFPNSDGAAVYAAVEDGTFKKHGLDIELQPVLTASGLTASLTSGKVDVMHQSLPSSILAISSGLPLKMISGVTQMPTEGYVEVLVPKDSDIKEFVDLQGKNVATVSAQGIFDLAVRNAIEQGGGDPKDMKALAMSPADEAAALESGRVDAIVINDPFLSGALKNPKFRSLGNPFSVLDYKVLSASAYATEKTLKSKASALRKYHEALTDISERVTADDQIARDAMATFTELPPAAIKTLGLPTYSADMDTSSIGKVSDQMTKFGWLKKPVTADDVVWNVQSR